VAQEHGRTAPGTGRGKGIRVAGNDRVAQRLRAGRAVVQSMKPGRRPGLWMVHYVMPHVPWRFLPDGTQYVVDGPAMPGLTDQTWGANPFLLDQAYERHLLQAQFADRLLGEAIDRMKATGLWNKALVIVTADHGGSVRPGGQRRPITREYFSDVAGVPLLVKPPGQREGSVKEAPVRTVDVMPTIAKQLGARPGWHFDGRPVDEPHPDTTLRMRNGRRAAIVTLGYDAFRRAREAQLRRQFARIPPGRSAYRIGPEPALIGRAVASAAQDSAAAQSGTIDHARMFGAVNPSTGVVPAYVTGQLAGVPRGQALAVAVDGRIRATGEAYAVRGATRFSMLVPPSALRRGANRVEVFAINGSRLRLLAHAG
jgi:hypothetical protein